MSIFKAHRRIGAMMSLAASVMILGGCRGTSAKPSPTLNSESRATGQAPFYRSYDSDNYESPANQPAAPFPGNSDQIAPLPPLETPTPNQEIPPAPSAQRSRWNKLPAGMKFPSMARNNRDVSQTAAKVDHRTYSSKKLQNKVKQSVTPRYEEEITEEVIQPRSAANSYRTEPETSGPFHSVEEDHNGEPPSLLPPDR